MSDRRNRPVNRWGCKPTEDVCVEHDRPLVCRHGCADSDPAPWHDCKTRLAPCRDCGHAWLSHEEAGCVIHDCRCLDWRPR